MSGPRPEFIERHGQHMRQFVGIFVIMFALPALGLSSIQGDIPNRRKNNVGAAFCVSSWIDAALRSRL
jgi:hypothetical protein